MSLLRYKYANNVRVPLTNAITNSQNTITFNAAVAPYNNLPNPAGDSASGGIGIATLFDNYQFPTIIETVTYTSLTNNGNGTYTIGGVVRGVDGTTAAAFPAGATMIQSLNVAAFNNPAFAINNDGSGNKSNVSLTVQNTGPDTASLGAELTSNGTFTGNAAGWTLGADWAWNAANNVVLTLAASGMGTLSQNINVTNNVAYLVSWTQQHSVANNGTITPSIGGVGNPGISTAFGNTGVNTASCVIYANSTGSAALTFTPSYSAAGTITVDNVSVKQITFSSGVMTFNASNGVYASSIRSDAASNVGFGYNAILSCVSGSYNSAFGYSALVDNTSGSFCAAFGFAALASNTSGQYNASFGYQTLAQNTVGNGNSAYGYNALFSVTTGSYNVGIGYAADVPSPTANGQLSIQNIIYGFANTGTGQTVSTGRIAIGQNTDDGVNKLQVNGSITSTGLRAKEGANAKQGTAVLSAGSVVVSNTSVTANSRIFLTSQADGGTPGFLRVSARTAGTSFTITSSSGTDTSTVAYEIFEPG